MQDFIDLEDSYNYGREGSMDIRRIAFLKECRFGEGEGIIAHLKIWR